MYFCHIRQRQRRMVYFIGIISSVAIIFVLNFRGGASTRFYKRSTVQTVSTLASCMVVTFRMSNTDLRKGTKLKRELPGITINYVQTVFLTTDQTLQEIEENFFSYIEVKDVHCRDDRRLGSLNDGGWNVCFSPPFALKQPCLVYSFGIGDDWRFEDEVSTVYRCSVLAFDPSLQLKEHNRTKLIRFKPLGLGGKSEVNSKGWKLKSLLTHIMAEGHIEATIDYLKFDIEYSEWSALESMLSDRILKNVKQVVFEIHSKESLRAINPDLPSAEFYSSKKDFLKMYRLLSWLESLNFKKFNYRRNPVCDYLSNITQRVRCSCYELHYVNLDFIKEEHFEGIDRKVTFM